MSHTNECSPAVSSPVNSRATRLPRRFFLYLEQNRVHGYLLTVRLRIAARCLLFAAIPNFSECTMSEEEYNDLVRNAAAKRQMVVRALQKKHSDVEHAVIEDCVEGAIIKFSDREKILNVLNPEKPFRWLLSTAEHFFQHERRRHSREISLNELAVEPVEPDREIESFEASEHTDAVFGMIHKNYSDILIAIEREGFSLEEIAGRESKPIKAIYNRYERAKIKAKKAANKLEPKSPPQQE